MHSKQNSILNRSIPHRNIKTEGILSLYLSQLSVLNHANSPSLTETNSTRPVSLLDNSIYTKCRMQIINNERGSRAPVVLQSTSGVLAKGMIISTILRKIGLDNFATGNEQRQGYQTLTTTNNA
ncbi:hypothetical protein M758_12G085900 [Ceratodon purpureus]|uniref:Uncharacterized protein n=1 Tax=Ceratodon purpureus TaxID=3225 RepID=A0A8T0G7G1_CERPU|nr:hypothetical protein KC19_12G083300 [Ceratodon purpureus]KAG0598582.1 hypothetical protein M758_12G085900 [Ceratodon purpureus]